MVDDATRHASLALFFNGKDTEKPKCGISKLQVVSNTVKEGAMKRRRQ